MGVSEIADMDIVTDAGSVFCRIVVTEHCNALALSKSGLQHQRNKMALRTVVFTDLAAGMCAGCVEVAEGHILDAQHLVEPGHHPFHCQLGFTVDICRLGAVAFFNRHLLRFAVGCRCGGENDFVYTGMLHGFKKTLRTVHVIVVVFNRVFHALADKGAGCEMDDRFNFIFGEKLCQQLFVTQIAFIQLAAQQRLTVPCQQIVDHYNFLAPVQQLRHCMGPDIPCSACY
ncbi:hypothetical protein D3C80_1175370 [compost metagenome]